MNETNPEILIYNPKEQIDIRVDYRNSNFKQIKFNFEEINLDVSIVQNFKVGKGGIFWDGVNNNVLINNSLTLYQNY